MAGAPLQSVVAYSVCVRVTLPAAGVGGGDGGVMAAVSPEPESTLPMVVEVAMQWNLEVPPVPGFHVHVTPSAMLLYAMPVPVHVGSDTEYQ